MFSHMGENSGNLDLVCNEKEITKIRDRPARL